MFCVLKCIDWVKVFIKKVILNWVEKVNFDTYLAKHVFRNWNISLFGDEEEQEIR